MLTGVDLPGSVYDQLNHKQNQIGMLTSEDVIKSASVMAKPNNKLTRYSTKSIVSPCRKIPAKAVTHV